MSPLPKIGVPELDKDHREVMVYLLQLNSETLDQANLDFFVEYFKEHRRKEEKIMISMGYPFMEEHFRDHRNLEELFFECPI